MSKLWSTRKPDNTENGDFDESPERPLPPREPRDSRETRDPDERTRLLPRNHHNLDPDDPAVSPYNLFSVRSLRWISVVLLVASSLWWILLLISVFVTPPAMHTRGSGFFDFA